MTLKEFKMQYALGSLSYDNLLALAKRPNTSKAILTILSKDKNYWVRSNVAHNPITPMNTLLEISTAEEEYNAIKGFARMTIRKIKTIKRRAKKNQNKRSKDK